MATPRGHPVSSGALDADALHDPLCADALHDPLCADAAGAILVTACHILCVYYVYTMFIGLHDPVLCQRNGVQRVREGQLMLTRELMLCSGIYADVRNTDGTPYV